MRITESRLVQLSGNHISKGYQRLAKSQDDLASGIRVDRPSDDPAAWARGRRIKARQVANAARANVIGMARDNLQIADGALDSLTQMLTRARELAVQAANDTLNAGDRSTAAVEVRGLLTAAAGVLNVQGSDGEYLLAGSLGDTAPFDATGAYRGNASERSVEVYESGQQVATLPGSKLTSTSGVDVLGVLDDFVTALEANDVTRVVTSLGQLDAGLDQTVHARAELWSYVDALNRADEARESLDLTLAEMHADAVETDIVAAASELSQAGTALQASQAIAAQLQELL